jgi:hypothetical protein
VIKFQDIVRHVIFFFRAFILDKNEKKFINSNIKQKKLYTLQKKNILIQTVTDYYYLAYYKILLNQPEFRNYNVIGLWPYYQQTIRPRTLILEILHDLYNKIFFKILKRKWFKLYNSIGVYNIEDLNNSNFILKKIKVKKEKVLSLKIKKIHIGDILYDTYLRFRVMPTLFTKDYFFRKIYNKIPILINRLECLHKKYSFKYFFSSYSSYIHNGLPVRFFVKKNIKVYTGKNNSQYNKKINIKDLTHVENYKKFKLIFKSLKKKQTCIATAKKSLDKRFSGRNDLLKVSTYLQVDPFKIKKNNEKEAEKLRKIKGVFFLSDFYDSPHDWGKFIFKDFYLFTIFTLNLIRKYQLPIAIKPHPNSFKNSLDSSNLYNRLKKKYKDLVWLKEDLSNKIIFNKIHYGISASGSVLFELAYHNIKAISCGDYPGKNFNFSIKAKNSKNYKNILLKVDNIKKPIYKKKDLYIFYYMYYLHNLDSIKTFSRDLNLKSINFSNSNGLNMFEKVIKNINNIH